MIEESEIQTEVERLRKELKQDNMKALECFQKGAELGYGGSMYQLGCIYDGGVGVPPDFVKAVEWYRKAAGQGLPEAMINLGLMYQDGAGVDRDYDMAMMWFRKAYATNNSPTAAIQIGRLYESGLGVDKSPKDAFNWYKIAGEKDTPAGLYYLGRCYVLAIYVEKDTDKALEYLLRSSEGKFSRAMHLAGSLLLDRNTEEDTIHGLTLIKQSAELNFNVAQFDLAMYYYSPGFGLPTDNDNVLYWLKKAGDNGSPDALDNLGQIYLTGKCGVEKNYTLARNYFARAMQLGLRFSFHNMGILYMDGLGVPKDLVKAYEYFEKAASMGVGTSYFHIGTFRIKGMGVPKDIPLGIEYLLKAADLGTGIALNDIARLYENGTGVERDSLKAKQYYEECVKRDVPEGAFNLGRMYEMGLGIPSDVTKALEYYKIAADLGFARAAFVVGTMYEDGYDPEVEDGKMRNYDALSITEPPINVPNETKEDTEEKNPNSEESAPVSKSNSEEKELSNKEA